METSYLGLILQPLHVLVTAEHLTNPDFEQEVVGLLRIGLRTKVLHELSKTQCIELIKDIIEDLDAI